MSQDNCKTNDGALTQILSEVRERVGGYPRVGWHQALTGYDVALAGERDPEIIAERLVRVYREGDQSFVALHLRHMSNITIPCGSEKQAEYIADGLRREIVGMLEVYARNA